MYAPTLTACLLTLALTPLALPETVAVDISGLTIDCAFVGPCGEDQSANSGGATLPPAPGYSYEISGIVSTSGVLGTLIPDGSTIAEMLEIIDPGASRLLNSYTRNFMGGPPTTVYVNPINEEFLGINVGLTFQVRIDGAGVGYFELVDIDIPGLLLLGDITIESGTCTISTWEPSPESENEWHFDDDSFTQAAGATGAAQIRYLDDDAFAPILGGDESGLNEPEEDTPTGITQAQSAFGSASSFGLPLVDGEDTSVYLTSPPRNNDMPGEADLRRGIGLALWPNTRPDYPGGIHGQWTAIYDVLIPAESWFADYPANTTPREWIATLLHGNHNNDGESSLLIRWNGASASIGFDQEPGQYIAAPQLQPDTWHRIAAVSDLSQTATIELFIDGVSIGTTTGDWLYNGVDGTAPAYGDEVLVDLRDWEAWGQFPNPWSQSPAGGEIPATLDATVCLFADLPGRGEPVYLANLYWADTLLSDSEIAALGGANAAGIVFTSAPPVECDGDLSGDGMVNSTDLNQLLAAFGSTDGGDLDGDGDTDSTDLNILLAAFGDVCG